jgi:hypothetical protein
MFYCCFWTIWLVALQKVFLSTNVGFCFCFHSSFSFAFLTHKLDYKRILKRVSKKKLKKDPSLLIQPSFIFLCIYSHLVMFLNLSLFLPFFCLKLHFLLFFLQPILSHFKTQKVCFRMRGPNQHPNFFSKTYFSVKKREEIFLLFFLVE